MGRDQQEYNNVQRRQRYVDGRELKLCLAAFVLLVVGAGPLTAVALAGPVGT